MGGLVLHHHSDSVRLAGMLILAAWFGDRLANRSELQRRLSDQHFAVLIASGHRVGDISAPAILLVYNDYRCGFCAELNDALSVLRARYPQHLAVVWKHFADPSTPAGRRSVVPQGAECASEQNYFEAYHAAAFSDRRVLDYTDGARLIARAAGVPDTVAFRQCLASRRHTATVQGHYNEAKQLGVAATPTMFLNGLRIIGAPPLVVLDSLIVSEFPR